MQKWVTYILYHVIRAYFWFLPVWLFKALCLLFLYMAIGMNNFIRAYAHAAPAK